MRRLLPNEQYGEFKILDVLGTGAFATVYKVEHPSYAEPVALKLSKEPVSSETMALRALREISILRRLSNPHVVHIFDHGMGPDERWFMVMELLDGQDLSVGRDFDRPESPDEAVRIIYQACLGLDEAHRAGIVHRDIKPRNLWKLPSGDIKVIDFGLARSWEASDSIIGADATGGHVLIGTPHYAQPEQVKSGHLTPASDVYSLGVVLYELLVGHTPLFADEPCNHVRRRLSNEPLRWLGAHVQQPVVPLEHYPAGRRLPEELRQIVHGTLAKAPEERPPNAATLAHQLAWVLPHELGGWKGVDGLVLEEITDGQRGRRFMVGPGRHRIGVGVCCDIELAPDRVGWVYAVIEWTPTRAVRLHPVRQDGFVRVDDEVTQRSVELRPGATIACGRHRLALRDRIGHRTSPK